MPRYPCSECGEEIAVTASTCPHCSDKKMTAERYRLYTLLYVPFVALVLGFFMTDLVARSTPSVGRLGPSWLGAFIVICAILYAGGYVIARGQRRAYLDRVGQWLGTADESRPAE